MGMNKLYLSEDKLRLLYKSNGTDYMINLINDAETIIYTDEFSSDLVECIRNNKSINNFLK